MKLLTLKNTIMKTYKIYSARLNYQDNNKFITNIKANDLNDVKNQLKINHNLNPFYVVIIDYETNKVLKNEHLQLQVSTLTENYNK